MRKKKIDSEEEVELLEKAVDVLGAEEPQLNVLFHHYDAGQLQSDVDTFVKKLWDLKQIKVNVVEHAPIPKFDPCPHCGKV